VTSAKLFSILGSLTLGFACGSIPFGFLAGRLRGIDVRKHGSGNIGFTNVYRVIGPGWAIPVLILDMAKGLLPTAFAPALGLTPAFVGLGAVLGHVFTPWLRFKGGKGVATTIGVSAFLCLRSLAASIGVYTIALLVSGFVSLSSIIFGIVLAPFTAFFYHGDISLLIFASVVGLLMILRHMTNIKRLAHGTEPRFGLWLKIFGKKHER